MKSESILALEWTPVINQLPVENQHVIGWNGWELLIVSHWNGHFHECVNGLDEAVTHWMPLPCPPICSTNLKPKEKIS